MSTSVIVSVLLIAAVWGVYLLPKYFGDRQTSMNSTEEFDRWTHLMADVQKRSREGGIKQRDVIRYRRRRTIALLLVLAGATGAMAIAQWSLPWLLVHLFIDSLIVLYLAALSQVKRRRQQRLKVTHVSQRPTEWEEPQIRVIAN